MAGVDEGLRRNGLENVPIFAVETLGVAEIKVLIVETVDTVASGEKTAEIASGHIENIRAEVSQVSSMINEIYHTTEEQTAALTLINRSVEQI
ncbi:TPA: hypothetical protein ACXRZA_005170 [Klebsiella pneumoniae]